MKTFRIRNPEAVRISSYPCVMSLGFFDGIHLGHQKIIETAKQIAKQKNLKLAVMTFYPHPSSVIKKEGITQYLTPLPEKEKQFKELGVDLLYVVEFDLNVAKIPHDVFVNQYLVRLGCKHAVAGFDFTYGFKGKGNMKQLKIDANNRFEVTTVSKFELFGQKVSSTLLREKITSGRVEDVPFYLGETYKVNGVIRKEQTRHVLHVSDDYLLPCNGRYEVTVIEGNHRSKAICEVADQHELILQFDQNMRIEEGVAVVIEWENFITDADMEELHTSSSYERLVYSI
ncbi:hypothetical protein DH09_05245 [Bacillaceae bacterium JMAK1]|nr:hypothetical protein DH09_05245 [Bacillaceae bacterium JMAK1]